MTRLLTASTALVVALCVLAAAPLAAQDATHPSERLAELMRTLPRLDNPDPQPFTLPAERREVTWGLSTVPMQAVICRGRALYDQGPVDGLEVLACLKGGKHHESLLYLAMFEHEDGDPEDDPGHAGTRGVSDRGVLFKTMLMAHLNLPHYGMGAPEASGLPARGVPLRVRIAWAPDPVLEPDTLVSIDATSLVRNRATDMAYPALPYVYTGSRVIEIITEAPGASAVRREAFMLDSTQSLITNFDEPDALMNSPFPMSLQDDNFEAYSRIAPPPESVMYLIIERCELPLTLGVNAEGALMHDGAVLDDAALEALLTQHYAADAEVDLRAVAIEVPPELSRDSDMTNRERILRVAARGNAWVVPVFTLTRYFGEDHVLDPTATPDSNEGWNPEPGDTGPIVRPEE